MSTALTYQDWNERVDLCLHRIVTGSWAEHRYMANPDDEALLYHKEVIVKAYRSCANKGDFSIESIVEHLLDHDENLLEEASEIIASHDDLIKHYEYSSQSYQDMLLQIKLSLAEESGFLFFSDRAYSARNDDLPIFVLNVLADMNAYFEVLFPPKYGLRGGGIIPRAFGQFDAQNVLFDQMVEYDKLYRRKESAVMLSPILCRLEDSQRESVQALKGVVTSV